MLSLKDFYDHRNDPVDLFDLTKGGPYNLFLRNFSGDSVALLGLDTIDPV